MIRGKFAYAVRETLHALRRNLLLTTASMLTVAVSLSLVGAAFLLRYGVDNATKRWQNGIEFEIFLRPDSTDAQKQAIGHELIDNPQVKKIKFVSQDEQYQLFRRLFSDKPEYLENVKAENLPPSYRVEPKVADADIIRSLGDEYKAKPGVKKVIFAEDTVRTLLRVSRISQTVIFVIAAVLLFAASLLIFNTIRMAIFARRREIEVMKLVGATNWFIRIPFMIEGLIQGVLGAAVSFAVVYLVRNAAQDAVTKVKLFEGFHVLGSEVTSTGILMLLIGAIIGAVGAGVAVTRFLDV